METYVIFVFFVLADLCINQPPCAAIMVESAESQMTCSLLKPDRKATLTVPPGAKLYEWAVGGEF